jgi:hypothetical protein
VRSLVVLLAACWTGAPAHGPTPAPAVPTPRALDHAALERLRELSFDGFDRQPHLDSDAVIEVRHVRAGSPRVFATVMVVACRAGQPCRAFDLHDTLLPELRDLPDTVFERGTKVRARPVTFVYHLAFLPMTGGHGAYSHAYSLYDDDGANRIRVVVQDADDPPASRDELRGRVSRATLEEIAMTMLERYTRELPPAR